MALDKNAIIRDAQKYTARGQIDKAITEWQKLLKESPKDTNIYNTIGDLYLKIKVPKEAIESYRKAASILQKDGFALKAMALYKKILNIDPTEVDALTSMAELNAERGLIGNANENYLAVAEHYTKQGSAYKALQIYERMVDINPGNINLRLKLADMYAREGNNESAVTKYLEAASVYVEKKEIPKAKEIYNKVISVSPKNLHALIGLSSLHQKEGNNKDAYEIVKKALELYPENKEALFFYGKTAFTIDRLEDAKNVFIKLLGTDPANQKARELLARIYLKEGKRDAFLQEFKTIIDGFTQKDKFEEAASLLVETIAIDPENPTLHHTLADMYRKIGRDNDVKKEYESLVSIYIKQGASDKAINTLKNLIEMDPSNNEFKKKLEEIEKRVSHEKAKMPTALEEAIFEETPSEETSIKLVPERPEEKGEEEVLAEAEVYMRYGLPDKAIEAIKALIYRNPENINAHLMLKDILKTQGIKPDLIEEYIVLVDMYKKEGDEEESIRLLNEAIEIEPTDKRILSRLGGQAIAPEEIEAGVSPEISLEEVITPEALEERISEADFYAQQGLIEEAIKVYKDVLILQPENEDIRKKITALSGVEEELEEEIAFVKEEPKEIVKEVPLEEKIAEEITFEKEEPEKAVTEVPQEEKIEEITFVKEEPKEIVREEPLKKKVDEIAFVEEETHPIIIEESHAEAEEEFIDFATELKEEMAVEEMAVMEAGESKSPFEDKNLQDIFQEFKKGVDREIGEDDYDTHYNLGIAYKEMGLIDEAIAEFRSAARDPYRNVQALSMIGFCLMDKDLYQPAINEFKKALEAAGEGAAESMGIKYDLGDAYERAGMLDEALNLYNDVYGIDPMFREAASRIVKLKKTIGKAEHKPKKVPKSKKERVSYL